jgi:NTE family protein
MYDTLVVSGGSMNGVSILGSLQYLKDSGKIDGLKNFIGTSAGALLCYFLIIGYTPIEIMVYICTHQKLFDTLKSVDFIKASRGEGAISFALISDIIEKMTIEKVGRLLLLKDLEEIYEKRFTCVTFNLTKNCAENISSETHRDMPCLSAIHMSCNIPVIFEPYKYGDCLYVDGGVSNNLPIEVGEKLGNRVIGLTIATSSPIKFESMNMNMIEYVYKLLVIMLNEHTNCKLSYKASSTDVIEVRMNEKSLKMFDFDIDAKTKLGLFSLGYESAKNFYLTD